MRVSACQSSQPVSPPPDRQTDVPKAISDFQAQRRDLGPEQVLPAAVARYGKPTRDIGSGLYIPQWDVAGGKLTVHPGRGPTFELPGGQIVWLIQTVNLAGENILHSYEISTQPQSTGGTSFWIGDVHIAADQSYRFVNSGDYFKNNGEQSGNFFLHHPAGHVAVTWSQGINASTLLESTGEREIAQLTFTDDTKAATYQCRVVSSAKSRMLTIQDATFTMWASWLHFWRAKG
jgi:hypothetical protein